MGLATTETDNKRSQDRRRVLLSGTLVFNSGCSTMDVVVRNVSDHGLRLQLPTPTPIPQHVQINFAGHKRQAEVIWQRAQLAGLRFV